MVHFKLPEGETFLDMILFRDVLIVCSTIGIYKMDRHTNELIPIEIATGSNPKEKVDDFG